MPSEPSPIIKDSKFVGLTDVPEVSDLSGRFTYNFFVPDELINDDGVPRFQGALKKVTSNGIVTGYKDNTQKEVDVTVIAAQAPRFVELDWSPVKLTNEYQGLTNLQPNWGQGFLAGVAYHGQY